MIAAISWIPKGVFKAEPVFAEPPSKEEIDELISNTRDVDEEKDMEEDDEVAHALTVADAIGKPSKENTGDITLALQELNMETYDDEDDKGFELFSSGTGDLYYQSNELDPYIKYKNEEYDSEDVEDMIINPTDSVVVCARTEDDVNYLEVWILEDANTRRRKGNFLAVGSMGPSIEIWDLDVIDEVEPCVVLGGKGQSKKGKHGKKKSIKYREDSHTGSVLGLAWKKEFSNLLANAIVLKVIRNPSHSGCTWSVGADVESLAWDPHVENLFAVSLEDGTIKCFDVRNAMSNATSEQSATFTLHAHDKSVTSLAYNMSAPNLLATGSTDKTVKLWDFSNNQPSCVATKEPKVGSIFSISFAEDNPFLLAIGGSKVKLELWDTLVNEGVSRRYEKYSRNQPQSCWLKILIILLEAK
ncbi:unnamed protein product [Vicia faba]|uniref:Transducin/WD40 repeat-like superfamily protein n=1 Tax=Vicia faba TaxID=3906 RepID=A0AAV0Z4J1_VICFA|nr:unnamed protein product [Vicia faba]